MATGRGVVTPWSCNSRLKGYLGSLGSYLADAYTLPGALLAYHHEITMKERTMKEQLQIGQKTIW